MCVQIDLLRDAQFTSSSLYYCLHRKLDYTHTHIQSEDWKEDEKEMEREQEGESWV